MYRLTDISDCPDWQSAGEKTGIDEMQLSIENIYAGGKPITNARSLQLTKKDEKSHVSIVTPNWSIYQPQKWLQDVYFAAKALKAKPSKMGFVQKDSTSFQDTQATLVAELELADFTARDGYNNLISPKVVMSDNFSMDKGVNIDLKTVRRVCANGLMAHITSNRLSIPHLRTGRQQVYNTIVKMAWEIECQKSVYKRWAETEITRQQAQELIVAIVGDKDKALLDQPAIAKLIFSIYDGEKDFDSNLPSGVRLAQLELGDTPYAILNAVTAYTTHYQTVKNAVGSFYAQFNNSIQKKAVSVLASFATDITLYYRRKVTTGAVPVSVRG